MNSFLKIQKVMELTCLSHTTLYARIKQGLMPPPVKLSDRCAAWPEYEIEALNAARIAQNSRDEIRELVKQLLRQRMTTTPCVR